MSFPQVPLDARVELQLAGTWTAITSFALQRAGTSPPVTITRGRPDETSKATASQCVMQLNNRDGRFSPRNPTGPYYPNLTRNTPLRVSVPASGTALRMEDDNTSSAFSGSFAAITGDIDIRLEMRLSGWVPSSLCGHADWTVLLNGDGTLGLFFNSGIRASSTMPVPLGHIAIRVTRVAASGLVTFYTSPVIGGTWTQLGQAVTGTTGSMGGTAGALRVGTATGGNGANGLFWEFQVYSGIAGTLQADPKFSAQAAGTTSFSDAQGNTWTLNGTAAIDGRSYRGHFECSSLPQNWDTSGRDVWTPVTAAGVLRRRQQGTAPLPSPMRRAVPLQPGVVAYWPAEDPQGSTQIASGLPGGTPMRLSGLPAFQGTAGSKTADPAFACSAQLPQVGSSTWTGLVPAYTSTGTDGFQFLLSVPSGGITGGPWGLVQAVLKNGDTLIAAYSSASGGTLQLYHGLTLIVTGPAGINGIPMLVQVTNLQSGPTATLYTQTLSQSSGNISGSGASAASNIASIVVNPAGASLGTAVIGHPWVTSSADTITDGNMTGPLTAWTGETAGNRIARLCTENSIASRIVGYPAATAAMGVQAIDTLANLLQYCEDADRGVLYEPRQCLGIAYRTSHSLLGQAAAVALDYSLTHLGGDQGQGLVPVDDDQFTINDVTVTRSGGSSAQVQVTAGPLSVNQPPSGAGDYNTSLTVYCQADSQLPDIAGWMTHVGTADAERYPVIPLNLARAVLSSLIFTIQDADIGDYVTIANPPAWLPPGPIQVLIWGAAEKLAGFWEAVSWNAVPEIPWEVLVLDDPVYGRLDTDGSFLAAAASSSTRFLLVAPVTPASPLWTSAAGDLPFDVAIGGEQVTVTAVGGTPGTVTSPAQFQAITSVTVSGGQYLVQWNVGLSGTLSAGDANNFTLNVNGVFQVFSVNPASAATYPQAPFLVTVPGSSGTIAVEANNAGTAGAVYSANIGNPQVLTVTRSVNGVVKAQSAGAAVALFHTPVLALV